MTVMMITTMLTSARVLALASCKFVSRRVWKPSVEGWHTLAISLYKERGYEMPSMKTTMTARLSVSSQRKGVVGSEGKSAAKT